MTEKKRKQTLLMSLLAPLLREWGYETVQQCLAEVHSEQAKENASLAEYKRRPAKGNPRPSAVEIVERLDAAANRKIQLHALATRFDAKTFLPSASDVRHFLEMRGKDSGPIKQRQDAFKKVLEVLLSMGDDELMLFQTSGTHAGPTQLGPLSDAIKATSAAVRNIGPSAEPPVAEEPAEPPAKPTDDDSVKPTKG
ncbi:hypothetical protein [Burkholderia glumae]